MLTATDYKLQHVHHSVYTTCVHTVFPYVSALQSRNYGSQSSKTSSSSTSRGSGYYSYNSSQEEVTPVKKPKSNSYKGPLEEGTLELRPPFEQVKVS